MIVADIKLGYSCNNDCIHCVVADQRERAIKTRGSQDLTTEEYKRELYDSRTRGCGAIVFTGGEPTIRKDLIDLLNYARSIGFYIAMQTNGRMFCYEKYARWLAPLQIEYAVALHAPIREIHDSITRRKGSFNQTVQGIKNLIAFGQSIWGKTVISKKNFALLPELVNFYINLGIKNINIAFPHAQGNAWKYFDDVVPRYSDIVKFVFESIDFCENHNKQNGDNVDLSFEAIPYCFIQGHERYVAELLLLNKKYSESKQLDGKRKNWETVRKDIKSKFPQCKSCIYDKICEGPWKEYAYRYGSEEFRSCNDRGKCTIELEKLV